MRPSAGFKIQKASKALGSSETFFNRSHHNFSEQDRRCLEACYSSSGELLGCKYEKHERSVFENFKLKKNVDNACATLGALHLLLRTNAKRPPDIGGL
jgi:hypothetical protein